MSSAATISCDFCQETYEAPKAGGLPPGWTAYDLDAVAYDSFAIARRTSWEFDVCRDCHERRVRRGPKDIVSEFLTRIGILRRRA